MIGNHPRWCETDVDGVHTRLIGVDSTGYRFEITQPHDAPEPLFSMVHPDGPPECNVIGLTPAQLYAVATLINSTLKDDVGSLMDVAWEYAGVRHIEGDQEFEAALGAVVKEMVSR
ncbi:hypothetical protein AB0C69_28490 [Actinomadura sp. NPDC048032]|uniref:hypothetical protein n=1 Tax=Actinomadura sp. NPDC048032 TaxID=3155747 RepID=UPI0033C2B3FA